MKFFRIDEKAGLVVSRSSVYAFTSYKKKKGERRYCDDIESRLIISVGTIGRMSQSREGQRRLLMKIALILQNFKIRRDGVDRLK